jgi:curved DNA-binding protein CbpA
MIDDDRQSDHYEVLQISPNAEPDTIHRVYRLLAQRFHPDNQETGDPGRFRLITDAYQVLSDPERRAQFDVHHQQVRQERVRIVTEGAKAHTDFELEQLVRLTVLEVLYTDRRSTPGSPGIFDLDLESLTGQSRDHLEFTFWYLISRGLIKRGESSRLLITADGVDYLEKHYETNLQRKRLREAPTVPVESESSRV